MKLATVMLALAMGLTACRSTTPDMARSAAIWSGLAGATSAVSRGSGGCVAACVSGMACNPRTGLCERARCTGCAEGQRCVQDEYGSRCVTQPPGVTMTGPAPDPLKGGAVVIGVPELPTPAPHHASDKP
ncbi:MAG TPA: hypothetical protein VFE30_16215 [Anaeromyxobacteraceae bacterium]|nr:hypothetical protein [Anaeromyxobacteraceae bacterium]